MLPIPNNPGYFENWIQYFRQINEKYNKKGIELEKRVNTLAEAILITEEKLENLHKGNDEIESKIEQMKADMNRPNDHSNTRVITWLRKYALLCDSTIILMACGASTFYLASVIPIMLTAGGCIFFIHFLIK